MKGTIFVYLFKDSVTPIHDVGGVVSAFICAWQCNVKMNACSTGTSEMART